MSLVLGAIDLGADTFFEKKGGNDLDDFFKNKRGKAFFLGKRGNGIFLLKKRGKKFFDQKRGEDFVRTKFFPKPGAGTR